MTNETEKPVVSDENAELFADILEDVVDEMKWYTPTRPELLKDYSFIVTSEMEHSGGICWAGQVILDGVIQFGVENRGDGGSNRYKHDRSTVSERIAFAEFKRLAEECYPEHIEPMDSLIAYLDIRQLEEQEVGV